MRAALVILAICSLPLSGCGTFSDAFCGPFDGHAFYRGVRLDIEAVKEGGPLVLMAADIPFSAVADTLLLPFDAWNPSFRDPPRETSHSVTDEQKNGDKRKDDSPPQSTPKQ